MKSFLFVITTAVLLSQFTHAQTVTSRGEKSASTTTAPYSILSHVKFMLARQLNALVSLAAIDQSEIQAGKLDLSTCLKVGELIQLTSKIGELVQAVYIDGISKSHPASVSENAMAVAWKPNVSASLLLPFCNINGSKSLGNGTEYTNILDFIQSEGKELATLLE